MMLHFIWNLFNKTGKIEYFMVYKEFERVFKKNNKLKKAN
jgi:hypothetical protein